MYSPFDNDALNFAPYQKLKNNKNDNLENMAMIHFQYGDGYSFPQNKRKTTKFINEIKETFENASPNGNEPTPAKKPSVVPKAKKETKKETKKQPKKETKKQATKQSKKDQVMGTPSFQELDYNSTMILASETSATSLPSLRRS